VLFFCSVFLVFRIFRNFSIFKTLYYEKSVLGELKKIIHDEKIEIVHFESSYTGFYIGRELKKMGVKIILGTENIEHMLYFDYAKSLKKFYLRPFVNYQATKLRDEEVAMMRGSDRVTVITEDEKDILKKNFGIESEIVANGIEPDAFSYAFSETKRNNILFVGNFSYFPNTDAFVFFYKEVFPKIDKDITVTVIGKEVSSKFKNTDRRIIKKDFVEDIIAEYRNADMLIFPIRIGGGTNFKVLEAMSLGVPIIANPARLSGLRARSDEHFLPAVSADEYVSQIEKMEDAVLRKKTFSKCKKAY
jgi:glycosyltransferase involved in cell wall biosynthesis